MNMDASRTNLDRIVTNTPWERWSCRDESDISTNDRSICRKNKTGLISNLKVNNKKLGCRRYSPVLLQVLRRKDRRAAKRRRQLDPDISAATHRPLRPDDVSTATARDDHRGNGGGGGDETDRSEEKSDGNAKSAQKWRTDFGRLVRNPERRF